MKLDPLAVQPADVQHGMHQFLDRFEGARQPARQFALGVIHRRIGQRRQKQPCGGQGLQQVMAGGAQKAGLGPVGFLGGGAGDGQFAIALGQIGQRLFQLAGPGQDLLFQRHGGLKHRPGRSARFLQPVDPADQHLGDAGQLFDAAGAAVIMAQHRLQGQFFGRVVFHCAAPAGFAISKP